MSKQSLFLSVVFLLFTSVFGQFPVFNARLTGDQMIPSVNSQRTAVLQVLLLPSGSPGLANPNGDPYGLGVFYTITTDINDFTGFSLYVPAPGDTGPLLIDVATTSKSGKVVIPVAGSDNNYSAIIAYQNLLKTYFSIGYAYGILRTNAFPNGELRGDFVTAISRGDSFYGASLFPFPLSDAAIHLVSIGCDTPITGETTCVWNSALPIGGAVDLQGPNDLLIQLIPVHTIGPGPGPGFAGLGNFAIPSPFTVAQFTDFGNRGELRLSYRIGTAEVASTALAISGKPPTIEAKLNGANVVPAVTTSATGTVDIVFDRFKTVTLSHTVSDATRFTLNSGAAGANGEELINFLPSLSPVPGDLQFNLDLPASFPLYNLIASSQQAYVTLSSAANPQGEIRGQLTYHPNNEFSDTLSGQKMVPSVSSQLTGQAVLRYDSLLNALYFNISSTSTSTSAVLLRGPANSTSTGPILATLCSFKCNLRRIFFGVLQADSGAFSSGQTISSTVEVLLKGEAYVELQTTQNPSGELRANLVASINNNPPSQLQDSAFERPDIDIITGLPSPSPSIPRLFRRRNKAH